MPKSKRQRRKSRRQLNRIQANTVQASFRVCDEDAEELQLEAAEGNDKLKKFSMLAYTGGKLNVGFGYPVVVDLSGMKVSTKSRPILRDHDTSRVVGHTNKIQIANGAIRVAGVVSAANEHAREIENSSANGFPWQASIGATIQKNVFVDRGETVEVNGRKFTGPIYVARRSTLGEVSFVALGADDNTSATVAATSNTPNEEREMKFEKWLEAKGFDADALNDQALESLKAMWQSEQDADSADNRTQDVQASANDDADDDDSESVDVVAQMRLNASREASRIAEIEEEAAKFPDIKAKAIAEGWDVTKTQLEVLRASRPKAPAGHIHEPDFSGDVMASAVLLACRSDEDSVVTEYGEKSVVAARKNFRHGVSLQELLAHYARQNGWTGRTVRGNEKAVLQAAFSTTTLPQILGNTANKMIMEGFNYVESTWRELCVPRPVSDFKAHTIHRLTGDMQYEEVGPDGKLKHAEVGETNYTNAADTYGKIFSLTRRDIRNDDLGALAAVRSRLGRGAALKLNDVFWTAFIDNSTFFASGNSNYFDGAATLLQSSSLTTAVKMFREQTDEDGKPLGVTPALLLVPPALEVDADELFVSTNNNTGGSSTKSKVPNRNSHAGKYRPLTSAYLSNSSYTGYSDTAWYLLADPLDLATMDVVFLDGNEMPVVEEAEADFDTLGVQFRGYHDFGVSKHEYRAGVKSKGAA